VDVDAAARLVDRIKELARATHRPEVLAGVGPFSGLFRLSGYRDPVLVASADGVGTKLKIAALLGRYDTVGIDLVNHCVNDILTTGAEPLFFLDYLGSSDLSEEAKTAIVQGVASACQAVGCALLGGETADMPDIYGRGDFDLVGFIVGVVERGQIIDGSTIRAGDVLLGLPSSGLHTNGYSLVRKVFGVGLGGDPEEERARLNRTYPGLDGTLGEALLAPHRCYHNVVRAIREGRAGADRDPPLHGIAHITGGGIPGNLPRILPDGPSAGSGQGLAARLRRGSWPVQPIFRLIQEQGKVAEDEMYRTFNMGLGIILACAPADVEAERAQVAEALVVGEVVEGPGEGDKRVVWA
ncbi:MAG: phosphoribosylformylglycinamidine cyclo-ligase, partial [Dehalococcoidia bacterium]|nr:phosphoribosylformylglycinamidine cyclo-ligase [Dehalococcoidia bacterium]